MHSKYIISGAGIVGLALAAPTASEQGSTLASRTVSKAFDSKAKFASTKALRRRAQQERAAELLRRDPTAVVTGTAAVTTINDNDGIGAGSNTYTSYSGDGTPGDGWPTIADWVSFDDMFQANEADMLIGCGNEAVPEPNDSQAEINEIQASIESIAAASGVDHRYILAIIMQESNGCVRVPTTDNGYDNPGLMQDFEGTHSCNSDGDVQNPCPSSEIYGMIQDGAQGTAAGNGLATDINTGESNGATDSQVFYQAARLYNSGSLCSTDLSEACGATASYVSDVANRLTGWLGN